jgi:ribonuclease BN (tRNA processing enzyme)
VPKLRFVLNIFEVHPEAATTVYGVAVTPFLVRHPSGAPSYALRLAFENKTICYTGDTEWVEALVAAGREADLLIAEAHSPERAFHMHWPTLRCRLPEIGAKRVLLTHLSAAMVAQPPEDFDVAEDGEVIVVD